MMMNSSSQRRRIASNLLLLEGQFVANPLVEIDEAAGGIITSVSQYDPQRIDQTANTEFFNGIMVPGFINTHCHLELSYLRGAITEGGGFAHFARSMGEVRNSFSEAERMTAIEAGDIEMWREGVDGVGDILNGASSLATKSRSKIKYHNFAELFGLNTNDMSSIAPLLSEYNTTATPHSTYSLNDKIFREIASQEVDAPLSIHFMESPAELELYEGRGSLHEWYSRVGFECDFLHYGSPAERLVASIPRDRSVLLVHNCCIRECDIELIMSHFTTPIYWVVCPQSNNYISRLTPPTELLRRYGANICIGTDSLASNHSLSILSELRAMSNIPLAERLDWATRQGAAALKFSDLGSIEVGKHPSINILEGVDYSTMELTPKARIRRI